MKYIFLLSGDYIKLGIEEAVSLFDFKNYEFFDRFLIVGLKNNLNTLNKSFKRLALTKSIYKLLFECDFHELIGLMEKYNWDSVYRDNFCLRTYYVDYNKNPITKKSIRNKINKEIKNNNIEYSEKDLAKYIWHSVKNPKVNLENPKTKIELFFINKKAYCGLQIFENKEDFESRKAHLRPFTSPSSLHPKLSRALVNISGIKGNEILFDPFCGTGGFLIEAGLMGIKIVGYDISKNMVKGCKGNLNHFGIKNYKVVDENAIKIKKKFDYVVTDLPYGLNSNVYLQYNKNSLKSGYNKINLKINKKGAIKNIEQFYLKFLKKLRKILKKRAVIIFPHYVNYRKLIKTSKLTIEKEFSIHVHRSLTRKIVLLRNQ